jgi:hypothetical protein
MPVQFESIGFRILGNRMTRGKKRHANQIAPANNEPDQPGGGGAAEIAQNPRSATSKTSLRSVMDFAPRES